MFEKHSESGYRLAIKGIELKTRVYGEKTLMTEFRLRKGSTLPRHTHPHEQTGYLVKGRIRLSIGAEKCDVQAGDTWCIPGGVEHGAEIIEDSVAIEVFSPVREDYLPKEADPCRCPWVDLSKADYVEYHDKEWGVPVYDDRLLFEFLTLESAQAGLSWYTVLKKRENYRRAFENFEPEKIARFDQAKIEGLLLNPGIIRNRLKIEATVNNAHKFLEVQAKYGSFSKYIWGFVGGKPKINTIRKLSDYPATSKESDALSKDLKNRGFKFLGSTICYAHMQATGMVNDHAVGCFRKSEIIEKYGK